MNSASLQRLASTLKGLRHKHRLSVNRLAKATGISRRTLARIESGLYSSGARGTKHEARALSPRIAARLAKLLLPREQFEQTLADATRLSHTFSSDPDPLLKLLDPLYDYPSFLFHDSPGHRALREEYGADYTHSLPLLLRSGFGTRNLGARLRAFRMQHDLTLVETADLLGLSKSELHRLERAQRQPSPGARYRILRLLTLPAVALREGGPTLAKALLSLPPPAVHRLGVGRPKPDALDALRYYWLTSHLSTRELAADLGISQPHLIRLLRGDRRPSRKLRERIAALTPRVSS